MEWFLYLLQVGLAMAIPATTTANQLPMQTIAGVTVVDTSVVRAAQDLVRQYSSDSLYNHVMRSWLFGALIVNHNETLTQTVDLEAHAVAALMHDLGVTEGSPFISTDRRFEVDGAFAATEFLSGDDSGKDWDGRRVQLVWDAIALHAENAISKFKEPSVAVTSDGVRVDFLGPSYGVTSDEYAAVVNEFPTDGFIAGFNSSLLWIAETKPNSTYDTWQQPWGDYFVANYSAAGQRIFDIVAGIHYKLVESR